MLQDHSILNALQGLAPERKPRLLLVDDQPLNIRVMHSIFMQECELFMATNGAQALKICAEQSPDLIVLDIVMPEMDGFEVCRRLKLQDQSRHIPIIFITGHTNAEEETKGLAIGAVDFISKPFNPDVLRARVQTHLTLKFQSDVLRNLVFLDGLTGLFNRRYFDQQVDREWARAARQQGVLSLIIIDVDHFKFYNDHYGHQQGDECLREIAKLLVKSSKRSSDIVARYGGEEFVCLLPDTNHENAMQLAHAIEAAVRVRAIPHSASPVADVVTVSVGVASSIAAKEQAYELLALADQQLYRAKQDGRARVCGKVLTPGESS